MYTFQQSTGRFTDAAGSLIADAYSGHGPGVNNPSMENVPKIGPLPRGLYTIGPAENHPHLGPIAMPLTADPGSQSFGRCGFFLHGDNGQGNRSASEGCIILPRDVREKIAAGADRRLRVVE